MTLERFTDRDLVAELERLVAKARRGDLIGIVYAIEVEPGQHFFGMSRRYAGNPHEVLKVATRATYKVNQYISALAGEPTTDLVPL